MSQATSGGREDQPAVQSHDRSRAEWLTLGISVTLLIVVVGLVIFEYVSHGSRPAVIVVEPQPRAVRQEGDAFYLPVEISNRGDLTVEDIQVQISLSSSRGQHHLARLSLKLLAGGDTEQGVVVFPADPRQGDLTVDSISFFEP